MSSGRLLRLNSVFVLLAVVSVGVILFRQFQPADDALLSGVPPVSQVGFTNASSEVAYVGTAVCARCHAGEHQSYLDSMHSRSFRVTDPEDEPVDGTFQTASGARHYRIYRDEGLLRHREFVKTRDGNELTLADHPVVYTVGSGHLALTYLARVDGFLIESPATWYRAQQSWALSPGYDDRNCGFDRPVYFECLSCHVGRSTRVDNGYARYSIDEQSIGCERCHGPGELHVARWSDASAETLKGRDETIIHPGRLDRERREAICAECHLHGGAAVPPTGRDPADFRPGLLLSDFRIDYRLEVQSDSMTVVGHLEQMRASRCYQQSDSLTCTTCHDPHHRSPPEGRIADLRSTCLGCHEQRGCSLDVDARRAESREDNCVQCHMRSSTTDIPHVAATHHRIAVPGRESADGAAPVESFPALVPFDDLSRFSREEQDRCLGLGYLQLSMQQTDRESAEVYRRRGRDLLQSLIEKRGEDGEALSGLAQLVQAESPTAAAAWATKSLESKYLSPKGRVGALFALSNARMAERRFDAAIEPLERLVESRRQAGDWYQLALSQFRVKRLDDAVKSAQRAVEIMPEQPRFRELLGTLLDQTGQPERAAEERRRAALLATGVDQNGT